MNELRKRICFDFEEFYDFFSSLDLNCKINEESGNIEWIDGVLLKGEVKEGE